MTSTTSRQDKSRGICPECGTWNFSRQYCKKKGCDYPLW